MKVARMNRMSELSPFDATSKYSPTPTPSGGSSPSASRCSEFLRHLGGEGRPPEVDAQTDEESCNPAGAGGSLPGPIPKLSRRTPLSKVPANNGERLICTS